MRVMVVGDAPGVKQALRHLGGASVVALCAASIRPQYLAEMHELAEARQIPLLVQPKQEAVDFASFATDVAALKLDLIVVNSYSMLLPSTVLRLSRLGGVNVHGSLLPKNRGPNPIQWAMMRGEVLTGVTLHEMSDEFDAGGIIGQLAVPIFFDDTWQEVRQRLDEATERLLESWCSVLLSGEWTSQAQDEAFATKNPRRTEMDSRFEWTDRLIDVYRLHRAVLPPLPPAWAVGLDGETVQLVEPMTPMTLMNVVWSQRQAVACERETMGIRRSTTSCPAHLRPLRREDASLLYGWQTDPQIDVKNLLDWPQAGSNLDSWLETAMRERSDLIAFVIEDSDGIAAGMCQLGSSDWSEGTADLGVWIAPEVLRRGMKTQAVISALTFGFTDLGSLRLRLTAGTADSVAVRDLEGAGFQVNGHPNGYCDGDGGSPSVTVVTKGSR